MYRFYASGECGYAARVIRSMEYCNFPPMVFGRREK